RLQREEKTERVGGDQQQRKHEAYLLRHRLPVREVKVGDRARGEQRDRRHQQQRRIKPPAGAVVILDVVVKAADQERSAEHKERIGDDGAGDRRLDERVLAGMKRGNRDDQLGEIAERGVEQSADGVAGFLGNGFGGAAEKRRERDDRENGEGEEQSVRFR